jgi:hypothetical protein
MIVDFVSKYNREHGRGGQSAASRKFGVTILSISNWLGLSKVTGSRNSDRAASRKSNGLLVRRIAPLIILGKRIEAAELELKNLRLRMASLKSDL